MSANLPKTITRRQFLGTVAAGAGLVGLSHLSPSQAATARGTATDRVLLGKSGVRVSRLGMGTGTNSGHVQRTLGQEGFTRVVRHAVDRGVTFFDTADNYGGMHEMLGAAIKGIDRERIQIQSKIPGGKYDNPLAEIDRFRKEVGTDYFDLFLMHHMHTPNWIEENKRLFDVLEEAKHRKWIRAHGVSIHGLEPLKAGTVLKDWIEVALLRVNHNGRHMDASPTGAPETNEALRYVRQYHDNGAGVIGMKLIGNGDFTDPNVREQSIRFVMSLDYVDAVVIGFKSAQEIDEAINRMNTALQA